MPKTRKKTSSRARRVGKALLAEIAEHKRRIEILEAKKAAKKPKRRRANVFDELFGGDEEE